MLVNILLFILLFLSCLSIIVPAAIGLITLYHLLIRGKKQPADGSNRINHIRLWWFSLTRENEPEFIKAFPWLQSDEWDNMKGKKKNDTDL